MILKSFGCSFIFGNELPDDGYKLPNKVPSQYTWPALLSRDLGYDYKCHARPGSGNLQILAKLLDALADPTPGLYVVGWTWIDRFDYCVNPNDKWRSITPQETTGESEFYYRHFHTQYRDKLTSLVAIKSAIDALKASGNKFIMTYMDDLLYENKWHTSPGLLSIQNYVRPYLKNFQNQNFLDWSHSRGFPIGRCGGHPLEQAHQAAFDLIRSELDEWVKS